jgi:two-component system, chemotaxis family, protein-glutamate methylesterase/glutaminase
VIYLDKIKALVVDDSALMRKIISDMINMEKDMVVIDTARNGEELIEKLKILKPDVITLDVEMPRIDGIQTLNELKKQNLNIPVIMLSSRSRKGTELTMACLELGAIDFVSKPSGSISLDINKVQGELIEKIRIASKKRETKDWANKKLGSFTSSEISLKERLSSSIVKALKPEALVIGASTGGPRALYTLITKLPKNLGIPVFVVQHMPAGFTKAFADRLNNNSLLKVVEASDEEVILKDVVYIAPGGLHMEISSNKRILLNKDPSIWGVRPAADKLFLSAAKIYESRLISCVLTGMGKDGAQGTAEVKKRGGITIAEDESTCTIFGMPRAAIETGRVDYIIPIHEIAEKIQKLMI